MLHFYQSYKNHSIYFNIDTYSFCIVKDTQIIEDDFVSAYDAMLYIDQLHL